MESFTERFIAAYHAGAQLKRQREQDAAEEENRKLRIDILKHQQKELDIEGRFKAHRRAVEGTKEAAAADEGKPMSELVQSMVAAPGVGPAPNGTMPAPGPEPMLGQQTAGMRFEPGIGQMPTMLAPSRERPTYQVPGSQEFGQPGYTLRPKSMEEIIAAQQAAKLGELAVTPQKTRPGETITLPGTGQVIAQGGPVAARPAPNPTEASLAVAAAGGDANAKAALALLRAQAPPRAGHTSADAEDAEAIADAIVAGEQPPVTTGLFRLAGPVRAALAKRGFNLATANMDWQATQRHLATLNGPQQTRMAQAIDNAYHSVDVIEDLAGQWGGGKFPVLNRGHLVLAKNGVYGPQAQQIATQLEAQIADVTSELGNVYMGGNSPTDHALTLAAKNLSANWTEAQLKSALALTRKNLQIRQNSMRNVGVAGATAGNPYAAPAPSAPSGTIRAMDPQGNIHEAPAGTPLPTGWVAQ